MVTEQFHRAAQYLAMAGKSFLQAKADDSHTNLGWHHNTLQSHFLTENNDVLIFDYQTFSLIWKNQKGFTEVFKLEQAQHHDIVDWLKSISEKAGINTPYTFNLHYDLGYETSPSYYIFQKPNQADIESHIQRRNLAQNVIEHILKHYKASEDIRIWPHHFDTGVFFKLTENINIGIGMAIPDHHISEGFYLYITGYQFEKQIELSETISSSTGIYHLGKWKGFSLNMTGITNDKAIVFFNEAINSYLNHL